MKINFARLLVVTLVVLSVACSPEPPKCGDEGTLSLTKGIFADKLGGKYGLTAQEIKDNISFKMARPTAFDEKIKKYSCKATLVAGGDTELSITYDTQLLDDKTQIVSLSGVTNIEVIQILKAVSQKVAQQKKPAEAEVAQQHKSADGVPADITGVWKGQFWDMEIQKTDKGYVAGVAVFADRCSGTAAGEGTLVGDTLTITDRDEKTCQDKIRFDGNTATTTESDGCSTLHGVACDLNGTLTRAK